MINVQTGEDFERLFLGISHLDVDRDLRKISGHKNFPESVEQVKKIQGNFNNWNPKRPKTELSMNLFQNVRLILGEKHGKKLRLFVSVGTRLDFHFGTDCFFEIDNTVVTIDLTISNWKPCKADVLIRPIDLCGKQKITAKTIARLLKKQLNV